MNRLNIKKEALLLSAGILLGLLVSCDSATVNNETDSQLEPEITIIGPNPDTTTIGMNYYDQGATAANLDGSDISAAIEVNSTVNTAIAGSYTIEYTVTNADNVSQTATRVVVVHDDYEEVDLVADIELLDNSVIYRINQGVVAGNVTIGPGVQVICDNNIVISEGTLTIGAGAMLSFDDDSYIKLAEAGKIMVNGAEDRKVLFRNYENDTHWGFSNGETMSGGIYIDDDAGTGSIIDYAIFERALTGVTSMAPDGVKISNSQFKDCLYYGIHYRADRSIALDSPNGGLNASSFSGCGLGDIRTNASNIGYFNSDLMLEKGVFIAMSDITEATIWPGLKYIVTDNVYMKSAKTTIAAGAIFGFYEGTYFTCSDGGSIHIAGSSEKRVVLANAETGKYWGFDNGDKYSGGIRITESAGDNSLIEYTSFSRATAAIEVIKASVEVNHSSTQDLKYGGMLFLSGAGASAKINGDTHGTTNNDNILTLSF